jgi:MoxR-like ATPase
MNLDTLSSRIEACGYISEAGLSMSFMLMQSLGRPLLVEGEAGVGKTAIGRMLADLHGCQLIRLQCYEGLDATSAIYEWNYQRQLLAIKLRESGDYSLAGSESNLFSDEFLLRRPLLEAISQEQAPVLLIDEIDRADEHFEALLLEVLSEYQVSVPELGTLSARTIPRVVLTSNGTRELSDALRRRCLYYYLDYPTLKKETQIVKAKLPDIDAQLTEHALALVRTLRDESLRKRPGVAETLDWLRALAAIEASETQQKLESLLASLVCLLKTREDRGQIDEGYIQQHAPELVARFS